MAVPGVWPLKSKSTIRLGVVGVVDVFVKKVADELVGVRLL